jgi:8-oxo-dGTP pyrophosphatase MutT (NUDIX family)
VVSHRIVARIATLADALPPRHDAGAAVLIVLREGREDLEVLLLERTVRPTDPGSGQVALPGGHRQEGDADLRATALRETAEEVGLVREDLAGEPAYFGTFEARAFATRVAVFAAPLGPTAGSASARSASEVAAVFWFPRSELARARREEIEARGERREVETVRFESHLVWGFTLRVLRSFFQAWEEAEAGGA